MLAQDEAVALWVGDALRQVQLLTTEITRDPWPSELPADLGRLHEQALLGLRDGDIQTGEARLLELLAVRPDYAPALGNLASVREVQRRGGEARALLEQAVAADPDYLFARCNLANVLIMEGAIDRAAALLEGLLGRMRLHIDEAFVLYDASAALHYARGEHAGGDVLMAQLEALIETDAERYRFDTTRRRHSLLRAPKGFFKRAYNALAALRS